MRSRRRRRRRRRRQTEDGGRRAKNKNPTQRCGELTVRTNMYKQGALTRNDMLAENAEYVREVCDRSRHDETEL